MAKTHGSRSLGQPRRASTQQLANLQCKSAIGLIVALASWRAPYYLARGSIGAPTSDLGAAMTAPRYQDDLAVRLLVGEIGPSTHGRIPEKSSATKGKPAVAADWATEFAGFLWAPPQLSCH
jgi:hypothetical protein